MMLKSPSRQQTAGFTLIELIVVMVIVGVLFGIAAPGWLAFSNSRRANAARDQVLQELRFTQAQARRTRQQQVLVLNPSANPPTIASPGNGARALGDGRPGLIGLRASATSIYFDQDGNLVDRDGNPLPVGNEAQPLVSIVVTAPPTNGAKRCVLIQTLLGAMRTADSSDPACN